MKQSNAIHHIVIGKPLVDLWMLLGENKEDTSFLENTVFEEDRNLANLLVKHKFMPSKNEIRRNKPQLMITLEKPDFFEIKIGRKRVWIIVGE